MINRLIIFNYLFIIFLMASCSDEKKSETQMSAETFVSKLFCDNKNLLACLEVSEKSCMEGFRVTSNYCATVESKFVLNAKERGIEAIDPICFSDKLYENLNVDKNTAKKCDKFVYSNDEVREKAEKILNK